MCPFTRHVPGGWSASRAEVQRFSRHARSSAYPKSAKRDEKRSEQPATQSNSNKLTNPSYRKGAPARTDDINRSQWRPLSLNTHLATRRNGNGVPESLKPRVERRTDVRSTRHPRPGVIIHAQGPLTYVTPGETKSSVSVSAKFVRVSTSVPQNRAPCAYGQQNKTLPLDLSSDTRVHKTATTHPGCASPASLVAWESHGRTITS